MHAAREGLGPDIQLLVDAGTVWGDDIEAAALRLPALEECRVVWLEEPFVSGALGAYQELSRRTRTVRLAGGEGCHNFHQARNLIDYAGLGFIQIDAGRIGGITTARQVAAYAASRGVTYVNHTFTTSLALSASLQPYADMEAHSLCEFPFAPTPLARDLTRVSLQPDAHGQVTVPDQPGLGVEPDPATLSRYAVDAQIQINGRTVVRSILQP